MGIRRLCVAQKEFNHTEQTTTYTHLGGRSMTRGRSPTDTALHISTGTLLVCITCLIRRAYITWVWRCYNRNHTRPRLAALVNISLWDLTDK